MQKETSRSRSLAASLVLASLAATACNSTAASYETLVVEGLTLRVDAEARTYSVDDFHIRVPRHASRIAEGTIRVGFDEDGDGEIDFVTLELHPVSGTTFHTVKGVGGHVPSRAVAVVHEARYVDEDGRVLIDASTRIGVDARE